MKAISPSTTGRPGKGFALIIALTLMSLILLLVLSLVAFSRTEMAGALEAQSQREADMNALFALEKAIGDLQKALGPDQRTSATAEIFDTAPATQVIDGVSLPHALGAWSTVNGNGDSIISRSGDGYLVDQRNPARSDSLDHKNAPLQWLISGGDAPGFDPRNTELTEGIDAVSLGRNRGSDILAPLMRFGTDDRSSYAYHVTDLGMAAPMVQFNPEVIQQPDPANANNGGYANLYTGAKRPFGELVETEIAFANLASDASVADKNITSKYVTRQTLGFNPDGSLNSDARDLLAEFQQELTTHNEALIIDQIDGRLKIDLSAFIADQSPPGGAILSGAGGVILNDRTPLIEHTRFRDFSPKFGALRDYIRLGDLVGKDQRIAPRAPIYGGGRLNDYPDPTDYIKHGVHPYIVEYSTYVRPVINLASPSNLSILIYPRVTLWNPYNVSIDTSDYFLQINQRLLMRIEVNDDQDGNGQNDRYVYNDSYFGKDPLPGDGTSAESHYLYFFLDPVQIEPGQSVVFAPASGVKELQFRDGSIDNNRLSATEDPRDLGAFFAHMEVNGSPPVAFPTPTPLEYRFVNWNANPFHIGYGGSTSDTTSARLRIASTRTNYATVIGGSVTDPDFPIVHTMDSHNWIRPNEGRWRSINRPWQPLLTITDPPVPPDNRTKLGMRLKAFNETAENRNATPAAVWNFPLLEMANMRASFYRRTPWDWINSHPTVFHEFSFGVLTSEDQEQPGYLDPFMLPRNLSGVNESSPFMDTSSLLSLRFTVFDIPPAEMQAFSFGQFRQTPLTQEFSAPSFIVGESLAPVTAPRYQTAFPKAEYVNLWWDSLNANRVTNYATWWQNEYDPDEAYAAFDYRYETNHALWDRYFFSTLPENQTLDDFTGTESLSHRWLRVATESTADLSAPSENLPDVIAQHLRLRNHHSVNSTSPIAWKSLLAMNMGMDIGGRNTDDRHVPFPGTSQPPGNGGTPGDSLSSKTWDGYRQLDEAELDELVARVLEQVKRRAPFISVSDFVNRRLFAASSPLQSSPAVQTDEDLLSYGGALEIAIRKAGLNTGLQDFELRSASDYTQPAEGAPKFATLSTPTERFANAPAHLTQGKILEVIGALLTARSDTFRIRAYGEVRDINGEITARRWCEAIVQRTPMYVDNKADEATIAHDALTSDISRELGRRFVLKSFRWLSPNEI